MGRNKYIETPERMWELFKEYELHTKQNPIIVEDYVGKDALEKKINEKQTVCVVSGELDKPKLYIKKRNNETYHIIPITTEAVIDLFSKSDNVEYMTTVC